jgi:hypothetical protein
MQFYIRPEHSRGEPVVKEPEAFFNCSFKTSDSVVQKQRMFRHCYSLNMNRHPKETSVGCWVNYRKRMANGATWKTAGLLSHYSRKTACANQSSEKRLSCDHTKSQEGTSLCPKYLVRSTLSYTIYTK